MKLRFLLPALLLVASAVFAAQPTIEFRGVMVGVGPTRLSLVDRTNDTTRWVEVGQSFAGYKLSAYDAGTETATLTKDGVDLRVRLNAARIKEDTTAGGTVMTPAEISRAVLNNLRQISAASDQYFLEYGTNRVTLAQLVGPDKYIKRLIPVDGESYEGLQLRAGAGPMTVTTARGVSVSYAP